MRELSEEAQTMLGGLGRFPVTGAGAGEMEDAKADAHLLEIPNGKAAEGDQVTGAARGTAYHTFLEKLDYGEGAKPVSDQLKTLVDREILSSREADAIDTKKIERFLESSIGRRAAKADAMGRLFREKRFMMEIPATDIYAFAAEDDRVLLQGIVDLYMVEEDGIVLVDYKTDRVRSADELIERYRVQLDYYADAISRGTGSPVKEKIIYSLALSEVIELTGGARKEH